MGKAAAHFIRCSDRTYRLHYIEWDAAGRLVGIYPLVEEIAGVAFFNSTLIAIPATDTPATNLSEKEWQALSVKVTVGSAIRLYHLDGGSCRQISL